MGEAAGAFMTSLAARAALPPRGLSSRGRKGSLERQALTWAKGGRAPARRAERPGCCRAPPTISSGSRATSSAPITSPASSRRRNASRPCRAPMAGRAANGRARSRRRARRDLFHERDKEAKADETERRRIPRLRCRTTPPRSAIASIWRAPTRAPCAPRSPWKCGRRINSAWLELKRFEERRDKSCVMDREELGRFLDFVKQTSLAFRRFVQPHHAAQRRLLVLAARRFMSSGPTTRRASST